MEAVTETVQFQKYSDYKDSGVDWLGEIPAHWEVRRVKFLFKEKNIRSLTGLEELLSLSKYHGVIPRKEITDKVESANSLINYKTCSKGDLIINKLQAWNGMLDISKYDGIVSPDYSVYQPLNNNIDKTYFKYLFRTPSYIGEFTKNSSGIGDGFFRLYTDGFFSIWSVLPPLAEQTRIADFLDRKTAQIDEAIAKKERLIELLNERRQVLIHQAVTRGLNPNAPMKDSGIDWIGEIPAHWEVSRINWLFTEKDETGYPALPLLIVSINSGVTVRDMDDTEIRKQVAEDFNVYKRALAGDIAFNKMRMWQGAVGVVPQDGLVSPDYVVARPNYFVNSAYYGFLFKTREYLAEFVKHSHGIAWDRNRLYWEDFKSIFAIIPPLEEQNQIVDFLNIQKEEICFASTKIQNQIQKLQELKATLINSAVTGKIRV